MSFKIKSISDALLFFNLLIANLISFSVIGKFIFSLIFCASSLFSIAVSTKIYFLKKIKGKLGVGIYVIFLFSV